jgi:prepilin-type N-terminal cleavage/methylation domain-containing protein
MKEYFKKGFTLIELLVVIAIIGILASIIIANLTASKAKGRDAKRIADIRTIQLSLEQYYNDNSVYPPNLTTLSPNYLSVIPKDPITNLNYIYSTYNASGSANCASGITRYHLAAVLESCDNTSLACTMPDNSALRQDVDWNPGAASVCTSPASPSPNFNGYSTACTGISAGAYDSCYDVTN